MQEDRKEDMQRQGERRRHPRIPLSFMVVLEMDESRVFRRAANLSMGGIGFLHPLFYRQGTLIALTMLIDGQAMQTLGEVVGQDSVTERGRIKFVAPTVETHMKLTRIVSTHRARKLRESEKESGPTSQVVPRGLLVVGGEAQGMFLLGATPQVLGRKKGQVDIRVDHPSVSKRHLVIRLQHDHHLVEDLGSKNGIYHEGRRVSRIELHHGTGFQFGEIPAEYLIVPEQVFQVAED